MRTMFHFFTFLDSTVTLNPTLLYFTYLTHTGGEGQYTQWVHCELIVGSETIHPAHTQWINSEHF